MRTRSRMCSRSFFPCAKLPRKPAPRSWSFTTPTSAARTAAARPSRARSTCWSASSQRPARTRSPSEPIRRTTACLCISGRPPHAASRGGALHKCLRLGRCIWDAPHRSARAKELHALVSGKGKALRSVKQAGLKLDANQLLQAGVLPAILARVLGGTL